MKGILEGQQIALTVDTLLIRLRRNAKTYHDQLSAAVSDTFTFTVPENELWIVWNASIVNDSRGAEPTVIWEQRHDAGPIRTTNSFRWPTISVGSGPPAANMYGGIIDPVFWPQIIWAGNRLSITDTAALAGDIIQFYMMYTVVPESDYT